MIACTGCHGIAITSTLPSHLASYSSFTTPEHCCLNEKSFSLMGKLIIAMDPVLVNCNNSGSICGSSTTANNGSTELLHFVFVFGINIFA